MLCGQFPRRTSVRHQNDRLFESNTNCKLCGKMAEVQAMRSAYQSVSSGLNMETLTCRSWAPVTGLSTISCLLVLFQTFCTMTASLWLLRVESYGQGFCLASSISSFRQMSEVFSLRGIMNNVDYRSQVLKPFVQLAAGSSTCFLEPCIMGNPLNIDCVLAVYTSVNEILTDWITTWFDSEMMDDGQRMTDDRRMEAAQFIFSGAIFSTDDGHIETEL